MMMREKAWAFRLAAHQLLIGHYNGDSWSPGTLLTSLAYMNPARTFLIALTLVL